jgi:hypothetical protein
VPVDLLRALANRAPPAATPAANSVAEPASACEPFTDGSQKATTEKKGWGLAGRRTPQQILDAAGKSKYDGERISRLIDGDTSEYANDRSRADMALASLLVYWCDWNPKLIDACFRLTRLFRDKWDEVHYATGETYGAHTIRQAFEDPLGLRRSIEAKDADAGQPRRPEARPARLVTRTLAEVEERVVQWLWRNWIALGELSILDGDGGFNKSTALIEIGARVTRGLPMPHSAGPPVGPAGVVFISGEDAPESTLRPRARVAGADLARFHIIDHVEQPDGTTRLLQLPDDIDMIEELALRRGAKLIVIDPVMGFLSDRVNSNSDASSRTVLSRLVRLAQRTGAAVVMVRHFNKDGDKKAMYRGGGSVAWTMTSRSAMVVGAHPDNADVRVLAMGKCNLGPKPRSITYTVEQVGEQADAPIRVRWGELVDLTADDVTRAEPAAPAMLKSAEQFLRDLLAGGPLPAKEVVRLAKDAGHSKRTLDRAKQNLKVTSSWAYAEGGKKYRAWELPGKKVAT